MTAIEYAAGLLGLKVLNMRFWDYSGQWGNVRGLICPKFSLAWAALVAAYYFAVHPYILGALDWLSRNLVFSFVIGFFYGVFVIDAAHSIQLAARLRRFAAEYGVVLRYERIKAQVRAECEAAREKYRFFRPFRSTRDLGELLREKRGEWERPRRLAPPLRAAAPARMRCAAGPKRVRGLFASICGYPAVRPGFGGAA